MTDTNAPQRTKYTLDRHKIVGNITAADIKKVLNHWINEGYAYTTVNKVHIILGDYFKHLAQEELITRNPMNAALLCNSISGRFTRTFNNTGHRDVPREKGHKYAEWNHK